jgi:GNAT superfamily N-acetyltransferase
VAVTVREASVEDLAAVRRVARGAWHAAYDELLGRETVEATVDDWYARDALVEAVLRANGVARLQLSVCASNEAAVRFYETRGYEPVGGGVDDRFAVERHDYAKTL